MKVTLLRESLRHAREKLPEHPLIDYGTFFHFSYVVLDGRIVGYGCNHHSEPALYTGYRKRVTSGLPCGTHSEWAAWSRTKGLIVNSSFELINIRLNKKGDCRLSEPCAICAELLPIMGCKAFFYTNGIDGFSKLIS